ncbi:DUF2306 domain-containing protein [Brevundimonas sp.]|uniref:DUF2306 domain-containing protein n=1 Tax=Brevundimonas sp. TaxID=1871086 RepID=UPI003564C4C5
MTKVIATTLFGLMVFLALGVALVSARYLLPEVPFPAPPMLGQIADWPMAVLAHVGGGVTALALGSFQLVTRRGPRRIWHRWAGRTYVLACLVGAVSGFWLALHVSAGPVATAGFGGLAIAWFGTTLMGWRKAVAGEFTQHRRWMIRSLSLSFSAVMLRIMLPLIPLTGLEFVEGYRAISFLCWVPNLLLAEAWLRTLGHPPIRLT